MATGALPYITDEIIKNNLLQLDKLVPVIKRSMASVSNFNEEVIQPPRMFMRVASQNGVLLSMPAYSEPENAMACKLVTAYPSNVEKRLPSVIVTILLFEPSTGKVSATMNGTEITTWCTAAASVVATNYLSNETNILAVLGAGTQARSHAEALYHVSLLVSVQVLGFLYQKSVYGITDTKEQRNWLVDWIRKEGRSVVACESAEQCVKDADVIVIATFSATPILKKDWVKPEADINGMAVEDVVSAKLIYEEYKKNV